MATWRSASARAHLSEYVARAARGEQFMVTDRGQPRAMLVPAERVDELSRGLREGWVTRRSQRRPGSAAPAEPVAGTPLSDELLADDRGD